MSTPIDYDNICEAIGVRIQDADHLVKEAVDLYNASAGLGAGLASLVTLAERHRADAVKEGAYLRALIHDTVIRELENQIECGGEDDEDDQDDDTKDDTRDDDKDE